MNRYKAGVKTGAGSTTLPLISIYATAAVVPKLREVGLTNTTATPLDVKLVRLGSTGTQGAGLTEDADDITSPAASCTAFGTHSGAPTLGNDMGYRASIGGAVGAGVIWTFGGDGIRTPLGTAFGIGVIIENGSGQPLQAYVVWEE